MFHLNITLCFPVVFFQSLLYTHFWGEPTIELAIKTLSLRECFHVTFNTIMVFPLEFTCFTRIQSLGYHMHVPNMNLNSGGGYCLYGTLGTLVVFSVNKHVVSEQLVGQENFRAHIAREEKVWIRLAALQEVVIGLKKWKKYNDIKKGLWFPRIRSNTDKQGIFV